MSLNSAINQNIEPTFENKDDDDFHLFHLGAIILFVNPLKNTTEINGINIECVIITVVYNILYCERIALQIT